MLSRHPLKSALPGLSGDCIFCAFSLARGLDRALTRQTAPRPSLAPPPLGPVLYRPMGRIDHIRNEAIQLVGQLQARDQLAETWETTPACDRPAEINRMLAKMEAGTA